MTRAFLNVTKRALENRRSRGFTLIELMVVLLILGVLLAVGLPSFSRIGVVTRIKTVANDFVADVYLARSEAIKRNASVRLCVANTAGDNCENSGNWDDGWVVIDGSGEVLKYKEPLTNGVVAFSLSSVHTLTFDPTGAQMTSTTSGGTSAVASQVRVCQSNPVGHQERIVSLTIGGRTSIATETVGACPGS